MKGGFNQLGPSREALKKRLILVGAGTIVFSLSAIVSVLVYSNSTVEAGQQYVPEPQVNDEIAFGTVTLVAPVAEVPQGTRVGKVQLKEVYWPRDRVPEGAVRDIEDVREMFAKVKLSANQPILRSDLSNSALTYGIGDLLPPGHRAVTIEVDATSGVEGWATPGAHVDVYLTYMDQEDGVNKTRVAVEDAVVLSYDGSSKRVVSDEARSEMGSSRSSSSTVTLAVPFEESLKIQTARAIGRISLALRNTNDAKSMGQGVFAANEWEKTPHKKDSKAFVSKGFARFTDNKGNDKNFVLGQDKEWWASEEGE